MALTKNQDYKVGTYNGVCGTLVALEYPEGTHSEDMRRTHTQVMNGRTPPVPAALVRFDSIDHKGIDHPEAHTCDEALGGYVVPILPEIVTVKGRRRVFRSTSTSARALGSHDDTQAQGRT